MHSFLREVTNLVVQPLLSLLLHPEVPLEETVRETLRWVAKGVKTARRMGGGEAGGAGGGGQWVGWWWRGARRGRRVGGFWRWWGRWCGRGPRRCRWD